MFYILKTINEWNNTKEESNYDDKKQLKTLLYFFFCSLKTADLCVSMHELLFGKFPEPLCLFTFC